jgi:hypothetical protein
MGLKRVGVLTIGAVVAALAVSGCGGDDDGGTAAKTAAATPPAAQSTTETPAATTTTPAPAAVDASDPVARAATVAAAQKGGLAVAMRGTVLTGGLKTKVTGTGRVDRANGRGTFTIKTNIGAADVAVREVMDDGVIYLTSKLFANRLPGKKSWMKINLAEAAKEEGFDPSALGTNGPSQDPSQVLAYLAGAGPAKKVGRATVRGRKTTRYRVDVDLAKAKANSRGKDAEAAIDQLIKTVDDGTKTIPVDVWLDARHRVLRERVRYTAIINNNSSDMDFTTDFTGFDVKVTADPPPASDTVDGLALLRKSGALSAQQEQQQNG